jgi:hypothetical protein
MAAQAAAPWQNTVHPIPAGSGNANPAPTATPPPAFLGPPVSKGDPQPTEPWHNTVHPIPAGSDSSASQQRAGMAANTTQSGDAPWQNTVHPIPAGNGSSKARHHRHRHHLHK